MEVFIDDGRDHSVNVPEWVKLFRFEPSQGSATKINILDYLKNVNIFFIFDENDYPKIENWHLPYIESPEAHLAHSLDRLKVAEDEKHIVRNHCGGK